MRHRIAPQAGSPRTFVSSALLIASVACHGDTTEPQRPTGGTLRVTISATGADVPGNYNVFLNGLKESFPLQGGATNIARPPGAHSVWLAVPRNCQIAGDNPRMTTVVAGDTTVVAFTVTCGVAYGGLRVKVVTTGVDVDPNGYTVSVATVTIDDRPYGERVSVASNGEVTFARLAFGNASLTLAGLALNCDPVGANRRQVSVTPAETTTVTYDVACVAPTAQLAYVIGEQASQEIHISNTDGTADRAVTNDQFRDADPAWSPDGARIAFTSYRSANGDIYVIGADGSNAVQLTDTPSDDYLPAWSPDGTRIAFVSARAGNADIFVMNADGTNVARLTSHSARDSDPAWSPDGRSIAFTSARDGGLDVYIMDVAGQGVTRITTNGGEQPAWSPDGSSLAYVSSICGYWGCAPSIFVKVGTQTASGIVFGAKHPAWSPNGRRIMFDRLRCEYYSLECEPDGISVATPDGIDVVPVRSGQSAVWRPRRPP